MITIDMRVKMAEVRINQKELAERAKTTEATISRWMKGKVTMIDLPTLNNVCKVLGCQPGDILKMEDDKR